ncbi:LuxR C-terminal-related transcriptional regulator [Arthrobacter sp. Y-9]|uniref:helix-turn-helix transcriptional regulator n=1 Tax=Arthrobacter sp. Y-9 TaxID=3039385 RepID=UPI0024204C99|nr:LuxR C-terminal-related transcriptional regulator [Arthrobacter sp. Y-9]WFR83984.1 LuxR C-terminal-related transcriptional regulator [Arthrobacter sp. Y-9]
MAAEQSSHRVWILQATEHLIGSTLHGGTTVPRFMIDTLRLVKPSSLDRFAFSAAERQSIGAAMIMAQVRVNDLTAALDLAETVRESRLAVAPVATDAVPAFLALEAALSEAALAAGLSTCALEHGVRLADYAAAHGDPRWMQRAHGLLATAAAFGGEHLLAEDHLNALRSLAREQGWDTRRAEYMEGIAESLLAFTQADRGRMDRLLPRVEALQEADASAASLVAMVSVLCHVLHGRLHEAMAQASLLAMGKSQPFTPKLLRDYAVSLQAFLLILRGDPLRAQGVLRGLESSENHFLCTGTLRASAALQLQDYRGVLSGTSDCLQLRSAHNLWTLPQVLLRRSIANFRLGNTQTALHEFGDAVQLLRLSASGPALLTTPLPELEYLATRLAQHSPELTADAALLLRQADDVLQTAEPALVLPALSERKRLVATMLRSDTPLPQIAQELHVAPSTVKSQAIAIYRKLQVNSRQEAVELLERGGFFES